MVGSVAVVVASMEQRITMIASMQVVAVQELAWLHGTDSDPLDIVYIVLVHDKAVGYCVFRRSVSEIRRLFIFPEYRRSKMGTDAIARLLVLLRKAGHSFITFQYSDESVAAFVAKAFRSWPIFTIDEGVILVDIA